MILFALLLGLFLLFITIYFLRKLILRKKFKQNKDNTNVNVGIFHPYCNAGGGGERVLWCAVRALQVYIIIQISCKLFKNFLYYRQNMTM